MAWEGRAEQPVWVWLLGPSGAGVVVRRLACMGFDYRFNKSSNLLLAFKIGLESQFGVRP
jgi:hypothetical protein